MAATRFEHLVLCYHAVSDDWRHPLAVPLRRLEQQLASILQRRYRPVAARAVVSDRGKLLHVTFDDAYKSVWKAMPLLETLRIPVTVFACPAYADTGRPFDVPELHSEATAHPDELRTMSWEELKALTERGVEIGSHTASHPHLTALTDRELDAEIRDTRLRFEDELHTPCRFLAYPYGEYNARVRNAARRGGHDAAFALARSAGARGFDPFAVPRIDLYRNDNRLRTALKTSRWYTATAAVRRLV
jgi:peptidoglycan/xylan/chitin deacetylase (PgdA/CDA1 family)